MPNEASQPEWGPALDILERYGRAAGITIDRVAGSRMLAEARSVVDADGPQGWARCLVEVAASFDLRVRILPASLDDLWELVRQGSPLATYLPADAAGRPEGWLLVERERRGRVLVVQENRERWLSRRQLQRLLPPGERLPWVMGQAALPARASAPAAAGHHGPAPTLKPWHRLLKFLRPEWHDLLVVSIFSLIVSILGLATPLAVEAVVNTIAFGQFLQPLVILSIILFGSLAFAACIQCLLTIVVEVMQRRLFVRVAEELAYRLPRVLQSKFDHYHGPELVNRFFDVVTVQKVVAKLSLETIALVLQTGIGMAVVAFYHPFLLGYDVVLLVLMGMIVLLLGRGAIQSAMKESQAKYEMAAWLEELVRHPTAFKFHSGAQLALDRTDQLAVKYLDARRQHFGVVIRQLVFSAALQVVAATALLGLGGWLVMQGQLTLGQLVAAELIVTVIVGSFTKFAKQLESFYDLLASIDKLGKLFDLPMEEHDRLCHLGTEGPMGLQISQLRAEGLGSALDLQVEPGEQWAIWGPPGSGKSRLLETLSGARSPEGGTLLVDGVPMREIRPDTWREQVGYARELEIFAGTLEENIHLGRPHILASDVRDAIESLGLSAKVRSLPEAGRTLLQVGGAPLSTNQALLLMFARACVGRPRLILIDGLLDRLGDHELPTVLAALRQCNTTVVIATGRRDIAQQFPHQLTLQLDDHSHWQGQAH